MYNKLSIAIAGTEALPSAFVVFRGFKKSIEKAAGLGYDGVELALKSTDEVKGINLEKLLSTNKMQVSCISTGQVFADQGLMFTDSDPIKRERILKIFKRFIDLASDHGQLVNIGRARGYISSDEKVAIADEGRFLDMAWKLCDYASFKNVQLVLEPVNRYEINFVNSIQEGANLLKKVNRPNMKLMPDVFHMNIEDVGIAKELARHIDEIAYVHLADSNRLAPGQGHIDFSDIFSSLLSVNYQGWFSIEILPKPNPDLAAQQAISYLKPKYLKPK